MFISMINDNGLDRDSKVERLCLTVKMCLKKYLNIAMSKVEINFEWQTEVETIEKSNETCVTMILLENIHKISIVQKIEVSNTTED